MGRPKQNKLEQRVEEGPRFRPLYNQVRDTLIRRLIDGVWLPGQILPSEIQLANELGVSQGTVRKALDAMATENLVVRRQGRGTFVARHDEDRILFQFFRLVPDHGRPNFPTSRVLSSVVADANKEERERLSLQAKSRVVRIRRVRSIEDRPTILEHIVLPEELFPKLANMELPNNLYGLYAMRFGISVALTQEKIKAVGASAEDSRALNVPINTPLLRIDRLALSLDKMPIEWRTSNCSSQYVHYLSELR